MKHVFFQSWGRIDLRPLSAEDAQKMRLLRNKNTKSFLDSNQITEDAQKAWYQKYLEKCGDYMFSVYLTGTGQWVGAVGIYDVNQEAKSAEFGRILIDKEAAQMGGLGVDTTRAACQFAFEQLGMNTVYLDVFTDNILAVRTYEKSGFSTIQDSSDTSGRVLRRMAIKK